MKQKVTTFIILSGVLAGISGIFLVQPAYAQESVDCTNPQYKDTPACQPNPNGSTEEKCEGENCCGDVKTSIISGDVCEGGDGEGGIIFSLLKWVLRIMTAGVGIAAVGGIGYGALLYTTAENKPEQTKKAIGIITNVVIGIAAYALMSVLLNFIIPGGVFT